MGENLFEEEFTIETLSQMDNLLEKLDALVDLEIYRPALTDVLAKKDCEISEVRPQNNVVLMLKVIASARCWDSQGLYARLVRRMESDLRFVYGLLERRLPL